ncbi:polysaccharide pyruvyl transferase family protein [Ruficoccus sp. ZRK36]|uniref:polysaccharide pyruvyl transferase family protein n=1 Tax=Ruficoccus sp. ZRK36 TaxID=2866311 RepID=UPI001C733382|nr:polysaccharide pyruvyl transferase family protein [Ruficoccus sp. ZRK36]QYY35522.1 polysaccharide pyruvyl transferase family protein [Ruficoccus sp. ZRK36]
MSSKVQNNIEAKSSEATRPCVLLRSSWQTVNIGDIGHSPGVITLLEKHIPEARIVLWAGNVDRGVREMLLRRFPDLEIVQGQMGPDGRGDNEDLERALEEADLLLHGSGPSVVAQDDLEDWIKRTDKPFGIYGVTIDPLAIRTQPDEGGSLQDQRDAVRALPADHISADLRAVLEKSQFVYCRDSLTLEYLQLQKVNCPCIEFAPDGAFGCDLHDDASADAFMSKHGLKTGEFLSVIPRLRYTPYHEIHHQPQTPVTRERGRISDKYVDTDLSKMGATITAWIEKTGMPVLLCPEMTYQVEVAKRLYDEHIPAEVKDKVVWRPDYWLPDEACSTYERSHTVLSLDNHSPIFALALGTPTIFLRHPTDTTKGWMWPDIGMDEWFFEIDLCEGPEITEALLRIAEDRPAALETVERLMKGVRAQQASTMAKVRESLEAAHAARVGTV